MTASQSRPVPAKVSQIALQGAANIMLRQGAVPSMIVRCSHPDYLNNLMTDVSGDCLVVTTRPVVIAPTVEDRTSVLGRIFGRSVQITLGNNTARIGDSTVGSTLDIRFEVELVLPGVTSLRLKGAGNIKYEQVRQTRLSLLIAGSGSIEIQGAADSLDADIAGSGDICARNLSAQKVRAQITGSGDIEATALASVTARVSGSGDITVLGNPAQRDTGVTGSGSIRIKKTGHCMGMDPFWDEDAPRG